MRTFCGECVQKTPAIREKAAKAHKAPTEIQKSYKTQQKYFGENDGTTVEVTETKTHQGLH